jgi:hypothetical protein
MAPVLQRSLFKAIAEDRQPIATDLLTAILVEGDTFAAQTLADHGLTVEEAANASVERYLAMQKESDARLAEMQRRIAATAEQPNGASQAQIEAVQLRSRSSSGDPVVAREYTLRIASAVTTPVRFKAAVSHDGVLDLYVDAAPFETKFTARQIVVLYEAVDRGELRVELWANVDGSQQRIFGDFDAEAGAIFEDVHQRADQRSGRFR